LFVRKVKGIFYGPPGYGKTHIFKTAKGDPRIYPGLLLNFEAGTMSIESVERPLDGFARFMEAAKAEGKPKGVYRKDWAAYVRNLPLDPEFNALDVLRVKSSDDLEDVLSLLQFGDLPHYNSVFIDSFSEVQYMVLREITEESGDKNPSKHDGELAQLQDYGRLSVRMKRLVRDFRDLDVHCIFTALPADFKDDNGVTETRPNFVGKLAVEIPAMVDIVGAMVIPGSTKDDDPKREILFQPRKRYYAKDRSEGGKLGQSIIVGPDEPTMRIIFDKLGIKQDEGYDPVKVLQAYNAVRSG
jgi:hypothetical protein